MSDGTKFTKREWIHLIITLSIVQGGIWFVSFIYANNSNALGYVSFAGTLISIILAVLAIGYTYGESQQQKNSSSTLANQLESLVKIKDKLEVHTNTLEDIKHVKNSILDFSNEINKHFNENRQSLDALKLDVNFLAQNVNPQAVKQVGFANYFINARNFYNLQHVLNFVIVALFLEKEFKKNMHVTLDELNVVLNELDIDYASIFVTRDFVLGSCIVTINNLTLLNLFNYFSNYVDPELIEFFKFCAVTIKEFDVTEHNREKFSRMSDAVLNLEILKVK